MKEKLQTKTASGHEDFKTAQNENFCVDVTKDDFPLFNPKGKLTCGAPVAHRLDAATKPLRASISHFHTLAVHWVLRRCFLL